MCRLETSTYVGVNEKECLSIASYENMRLEIVLEALGQAIKTRGSNCRGAVFRSDRESQFLDRRTEPLCKENGIIRFPGANGILLQSRQCRILLVGLQA